MKEQSIISGHRNHLTSVSVCVCVLNKAYARREYDDDVCVRYTGALAQCNAIANGWHFRLLFCFFSAETPFPPKGTTIHLRAYKDVLTYGGHNQFSTIFPPAIMERGAGGGGGPIGVGLGGGGGGVGIGLGNIHGGNIGGLTNLGNLGGGIGNGIGGGLVGVHNNNNGLNEMSDSICLQDLVGGGGGGGGNNNGNNVGGNNNATVSSGSSVLNNNHLTDHLHNHHASLHDSVAAAVSVSSAITGLMSVGQVGHNGGVGVGGLGGNNNGGGNLGQHLGGGHHSAHLHHNASTHDMSASLGHHHHHHHHHSVVPHTPALHEPLEKLKCECLLLSGQFDFDAPQYI